MDAIDRFARHVTETRRADIPDEAVRAARIFILDSFGVGMVGSAGPWVEELVATLGTWGRGDDARVWVRGTRLPAPAAAMCNAYQTHNSEFDCVHEGAVLHAMTVVLPAVMAVAERDGGVSGRDLITAVTLGVDVACHLGVAATSGLRFFRPATGGAFAAVAGIGKVRGFDKDTLVNAFSIVYAQLCGTMQAHVEGSNMLAMQVGFNARNAVVACDMAANGLQGPKNILEGPFGYFRLFEETSDLGRVLPEVGRTWRIAEMAHKPFPAGRAAHGLVEACVALRQAHGFEAGDVERVEARVPPLVARLVSRPPTDGMTINYARLCASYGTARALLTGGLLVEDFRPDALHDGVTLALARRVAIVADDNPDPNALVPMTIEVVLRDGRRFAQTLDVVYGSPGKPLSRDDHLAKFRRNCAAAATPLPEAKAEALIAAVDRLDDVSDVAELVDLMVAG